ncbi:MAG: hypothetical protein EXX96DRAFT_544523 [Benjaminiella poitrasii]|nr:MAG: hypothetical protein EXX96DRAFT_544523 [Benjaminiella poitrasii]
MLDVLYVYNTQGYYIVIDSILVHACSYCNPMSNKEDLNVQKVFYFFCLLYYYFFY